MLKAYSIQISFFSILSNFYARCMQPWSHENDLINSYCHVINKENKWSFQLAKNIKHLETILMNL